MESKKRDKECRSRFFTSLCNKSYLINAYNIAVIILTILGVQMIFTTSNIPASNADPRLSLPLHPETSRTLTITQEGIARLMHTEEGLADEHIISLTISGNYTSGSEGLKIDAKSLTGTLMVDDGHPIKLNIQKVGVYKDLRTLFYRAGFVYDMGSISGNIKLTSPLNFESGVPPIISMSTIHVKIGSVNYYSGTTSADIFI